MHSLKLIAGLGNPDRKHERDRHNVGFWFVSRLAAAQRIELKSVAKYHGMLGKLALASGELWLPLPQTYMNVSGKSVGALARYYKIQPQEILVVHDEDFLRLDLVVARKRADRLARDVHVSLRQRQPQLARGERELAQHSVILRHRFQLDALRGREARHEPEADVVSVPLVLPSGVPEAGDQF